MSVMLRSLVDMLRERTAAQPDSLAYTFLADGEIERASITYAELDSAARGIAATLAGAGVVPGDRAILLYPPGLDFVAGFFGALYAGVVAVPSYPPHPSHLSRALPRLLAIADDAEARVVMCPAEVARMAPAIGAYAPAMAGLRWIASDSVDPAAAAAWTPPAVGHDSIAFLQYTSGSTSAPRGVMVSHGNLLHNLAYMAHAAENDERTRSVSWLPVIHDMGLIEGVLQPAFVGYPAYLMAPTAFLQRPVRWLRAITKYGATNSGGPNFAYDLCVRKINEEQRSTLDLSTWRVAYNGAEPIRADTLARFHEAFRSRGFDWCSFYPVYGLAEATLLVSTGTRADPPVIHHVDPSGLTAGQALAAGPGEESVPMVCSGRPLFGTSVAIVDPESLTPLPEGRVGEVWISSPSVARGYWRRPEESESTFRATIAGSDTTYLRSGDLGVVLRGQLAIVGRIKDMLIVHGAKHAPQDAEQTAERQHPAIRSGCSAAFAVAGDEGEVIVLAAEVDSRKIPGTASGEGGEADPQAELAEIAAHIHRAVFEEHGIQLHAVVLLEPGSIPKTTSGKIRRRACADAFSYGGLAETYRWMHGRVPRASFAAAGAR